MIKLILLGYMGSGKSSVGSQLAIPLKYRFIDLDSELEKEEGMLVSEIFSKKGEIYFRKKEAQLLSLIIERPEPLVIATGGGTPCYGDTMQRLTKHKDVATIYLRASLDTLTNRLFQERTARPLIAHLKTIEDLKDFIRKHLFERAFFYNQAKYVIAVDDLSTEAIVEKIIAELF
jgi:shikimate kinase